MRFPTKIRTGYSFRMAVGKLEEVANRIIEVGGEYLPISDTSSTFAFVEWEKIAREKGLKPIFGVELAVSPDPLAKRPIYDYWAFFPFGNLRRINDLVTLATGQFRYLPLLTYEQALSVKDTTIITGNRPILSEMSPVTNLFIALTPSLSYGLGVEGRDKGYSFIEADDNRFPTEGKEGLYQVICGMNARTQSYKQSILTREEFNKLVSLIPKEIREEAYSNAQAFEYKHNAQIEKAINLKPKRPAPLRFLCKLGAIKKGVNLKDKVYKARLDRELEMLKEKGFEDYFYIISDITKWAKKRMTVGPARGSACGSLVCYLLDITAVDPIPYDLVFERFVDVNRADLPDIDIDFPDDRRELVFQYMEGKYGKDRVARLGSIALYKPRSALLEASKALEIPGWELRGVVESLINRSSGDARALQTLEDTFADTPAGQSIIEKYPQIRITQEMEGHPRHYSQHAAGIIVCNDPIVTYTAIDSRTGAACCNKKDAEYLNMLKIDALGLTQLSVIQDTLEAIGLPIDYMEKVKLDDPKAFEILNQRHFAGIFQFNGLALQSLAKQIEFTHLEDIVSITALARPGPLASGGSNEWVKRKNGINPVSYPHPMFKLYLETSLGIIIYQEQVMNIGRKIGGLSWDDVTELRKAMSKSLGKEYFDKFGDRFKAGAMAKGIPSDVLTKLWDDMCAYGSWAFNRSHSVAYGLISYWCLWLKAHYPVEFAAATLSHESSPDKQMLTLRELRDEGISYIPIDPDRSIDRWAVGNKGKSKYLIGPLQNVKGIGPKIIQQIMSSRKRGEKLPSRAEKLLNNPITCVDSLWPVREAFNRLMPDPKEMNIFTRPTPIIELEPRESGPYEVVVFGVIRRIAPRDENDDQKVADRGYRLDGPTMALNLQIGDDTDIILAKVNRYKFDKVAKPIINRGKVNKALYAFKGKVIPGIKMLMVEKFRYIGDME